MNEFSKRIKEIEKEIEKLEGERRELKRKNSNFYIGVYKIGDWNYWDEYYVRLGYITEEQAEVWVEKHHDMDDDVFDPYYFEVTEEIYDKYYEWYKLDSLNNLMDEHKSVIYKLEGGIKFKHAVEKAIEYLAKDIGIEYLCFMHPTEH